MYNVYILVTENLMTMFENKETKTTKTETSDYQTYNIYLYPASDRNLEIRLAETNTICSDIMLPY